MSKFAGATSNGKKGQGEATNDDESMEQGDGVLGDNSSAEVLIILDLANLETVKTKKGEFQLLNCDDHIGLLKKNNKDPAKYRPDIVHQEIMAVLDSPLNKAGKCRLLVHSEKNVLIEISPKCRVPRTFKRFSGLMVQLLHRLKIRSADGKDTLLKVIKGPISRHIPAGAKAFGFSQHGTLYSPTHLAANMIPAERENPIVLVFGAMASGSIVKEDHPYITEMVSISEFPLSGVTAANRVFGAIENIWGLI